MFETLRSRRLRLCVVALYALAMLMLGFSHRMTGFDTAFSSPSAASAYALPGGLAQSFCKGDDDATGKTGSGSLCDACRLTDAPGMAATPPAGPALALGGRSVTETVAEAQRIAATVCRPVSRGPPTTLA
ncbi:hypothetical protein [Prosthecodimorpha staleyi]|uniref:DUF2946 domain-containing protein n=1 Tax=Prosthecodimorpha staleyi TaxID=2840188 RepID=A0A947GCI3_9HYPH|nr:hypothetical protein [Prosthecodimorpha staleyi]MBT9289221.1 hypothetical protein [Prosthecodimorpha staleyi]